jgi:hypothetical protein
MSISVLQREKDLAFVQKRFNEAGVYCQLSEISKRSYTEAITPLLLELFQATSDPMVRLEIGRKLQYSNSQEVEKTLLEAFVKDVPSSAIGHDSYRWGIGSLLEAVASKKSSNVSSYLAIATDKIYGKSREMVVLALAKLNSADINDVLISLLKDEQVCGYAIMALGKRRATKAATLIRPFELNGKAWIRKEAAKALRIMEKATKKVRNN